MKRLLLVLLALVLCDTMVKADDMFVDWSYTVARADTNTELSDTLTSNVWAMANQPAFHYYWRTVRVIGVDTNLNASETLCVITQHAPTINGPWTKFDSLNFVLERSDYDTTNNVGKRISCDSTAYAGNYWRIVVYQFYTPIPDDTLTLEGKTVAHRVALLMQGKY